MEDDPRIAFIVRFLLWLARKVRINLRSGIFQNTMHAWFARSCIFAKDRFTQASMLTA